MGLRVDVGIDAQRDRRPFAEFAGDRVQVLEFGGGFDVEAADAGLQGLAHLGAGLADAGEHDLVGTSAGGEHAREFAARDDVEAGAEAREHRQDAEVRVGLHRIAHQRAATGQRLLPGAEGGFERGLRVHIGGRAEARGDFCQRQVFDPQRALAGAERGDRPGGRAGGGSVHSIRGSESRSCGTMGLL